MQIVHVVECSETWQEVKKGGTEVVEGNRSLPPPFFSLKLKIVRYKII